MKIGLASGLVIGLAGMTAWGNPKAEDFLYQYCLDCHDDATQKGDVNLEPLAEELKITSITSAIHWKDVLDQLNLGQMPPKKKDQPETKELLEMTHWITQMLEEYHADRGHEGPVVRRMNRNEYQNTVRDLLGVKFVPGDGFPEDGTVEGFDNVGEGLQMSASLFQKYLEAAEEITTKAIVVGPKPKKETKGYEKKQIDCELGLPQKNGGFEIASTRENRARVFAKEGVAWEGRYKVRFRVKPVRSEGKSLTVRMKKGLPLRDLVVTLEQIGEFEVEKAGMVEAVVELREGETVHMSFADGKPFPTRTAQKSYKGPAVIIDRVEVEGPLLDQWPPKTHVALFRPGGGQETPEAARKMLRDLARKAYRRPVNEDDIRPLMAMFREERERGGSFAEAFRASAQLVLCSPHFLMVDVPEPDAKSLDDHGMATRLSYFLWSSMPDAELSRLADEGLLLGRKGEIGKQVLRMLEDEKAGAFLENFVGQWLGTRRVGEMKPDPKLFPEYDEELEEAMRAETRKLVEHILRNDRPVSEVIGADYAFLNERMAQLYGVQGVKGAKFRKVRVTPESGRGGVLGQASFHLVTSNGTTSSPVVRGIYVLENLLGTPPPPPPPDVEPIEPDTRGATTIRQQMEKHRDVPTCFDCHQKIDPLGLALEGFDPIGRSRTFYRPPGKRKGRGPAVDVKAETADGTKIDGVVGLRGYLLERRELLSIAVAEKLFLYGTGRKPEFLDERALEKMVAQFDHHDPGFRSLIVKIAESEAFRRP